MAVAPSNLLFVATSPRRHLVQPGTNARAANLILQIAGGVRPLRSTWDASPAAAPIRRLSAGEARVRTAVLNDDTALGISVTEAVG